MRRLTAHWLALSPQQIFNMFAGQQEEESGPVAGMAQLDAMMSESPTPTPTSSTPGTSM